MSQAPQGSTRQVIDAPPSRVWAVLEDASLLPRWIAGVTEVLSHDEREQVGSVRRCTVEFSGRTGYIVERCIEAAPERRYAYVVDDDSLGFTKMFADYGFSLALEPEADGRTVVTCSTSYRPRGLMSRAMNALVLRRKFARFRVQLLRGLKEFAEQRVAVA